MEADRGGGRAGGGGMASRCHQPTLTCAPVPPSLLLFSYYYEDSFYSITDEWVRGSHST